jgi:hypothetical protein
VVTAQQPVRLFDDNFLRFFPAPMREPRRAWLAILTAWVLSIAGSLALATISQAIAPHQPKLDIPNLPPWTLLFSFVVFAPVVETLIMAGFISLFLRFMRPSHAIILSSIGWGIAHSAQVAGWGLVIWWPFLIFSTLFVVWRQIGWWVAVGVVTVTHMLQNLGPGLMIAYG